MPISQSWCKQTWEAEATTEQSVTNMICRGLSPKNKQKMAEKVAKEFRMKYIKINS